jgi:hypothetical protein
VFVLRTIIYPSDKPDYHVERPGTEPILHMAF